MKKVLMFSVLVGTFLLFTACRTVEVMTPQNPVEETLLSIYDRFRPGLILTGATRHTVAAGETLTSIAADHYEDGFFYPVILLASNDVVLDPDRIAPGMVLTIPNLQRNLNNARARANIRDFLFEIADVEEGRGRLPTAEGLRERANAL